MHNFHPGPDFGVTVLGAIDQDESLLNGTKAGEEEEVKRKGLQLRQFDCARSSDALFYSDSIVDCTACGNHFTFGRVRISFVMKC